MTTTVELKDGTADFRDNDELTNKDVKRLRRAARAVGAVKQKLDDAGYDKDDAENTASIMSLLTDDEMDMIDLFQRECVAVRIKSWSYDMELPKTADDVDGLPRHVYSKLTSTASDIDLSDNFDLEGAIDPKVATEDSDS